LNYVERHQYSKSTQREGEESANINSADGFTPCSPDMTICGDCIDNREKKKCPRLKEWLAKKER
jgi:hypothetical protein